MASDCRRKSRLAKSASGGAGETQTGQHGQAAERQAGASVTSAQRSRTLVVEGFGNLPGLELLAHPDGVIKFRYIVEDGDYPGFDGDWRVMSENERREHLRMGGQV